MEGSDPGIRWLAVEYMCRLLVPEGELDLGQNGTGTERRAETGGGSACLGSGSSVGCSGLAAGFQIPGWWGLGVVCMCVCLSQLR